MTQLLKSMSPYWNDYWLWMMSMQFTQTVQALLCDSIQHDFDNMLISYTENSVDAVQSRLLGVSHATRAIASLQSVHVRRSLCHVYHTPISINCTSGFVP